MSEINTENKGKVTSLCVAVKQNSVSAKGFWETTGLTPIDKENQHIADSMIDFEGDIKYFLKKEVSKEFNHYCE